jgi:hypothetical protein
MTQLPTPIRHFILALTCEIRSPAYLLLGEDDRLVEWGGELSLYNLSKLKKNIKVSQRLSFLAELLPIDANDIFLPAIRMEKRVYADVYIFHDEHGTWVLLLDSSASSAKLQRTQQRIFNLSLQLIKMKKEQAILAKANGLLEQRIKEPSAKADKPRAQLKTGTRQR